MSTTTSTKGISTRSSRAASPDFDPPSFDDDGAGPLLPLRPSRSARRTGQKMTLDELRRTLCPKTTSIAAGDFRCHLCPMVIRGGKFCCLAVAKHMHRTHEIICQPYALPCDSCNYVSWCSNLTNHLKSGACKYYPKSRKRRPRDYVLFGGKKMPLKSLRADFGFLTMKRNGEWACPVKTCLYRLFKDDYSNSTFVTRNAAMHMLEEHNHLLEFYACYCYLCPNVTFAQATMNQHMIRDHADMDGRYSFREDDDDADDIERDAATIEERNAATAVDRVDAATVEPEASGATATPAAAPSSSSSVEVLAAAAAASKIPFTLTLPLIKPNKKLTHIAPKRNNNNNNNNINKNNASPSPSVSTSTLTASSTSLSSFTTSPESSPSMTMSVVADSKNPVLKISSSPSTTSTSTAAVIPEVASDPPDVISATLTSPPRPMTRTRSSSAAAAGAANSSPSKMIGVVLSKGKGGRGGGAAAGGAVTTAVPGPNRFQTGISLDRYSPPLTESSATNDSTTASPVVSAGAPANDIVDDDDDQSPSGPASTATTATTISTTESSISSASANATPESSTVDATSLAAAAATTSTAVPSAAGTLYDAEHIAEATKKITASLASQTGSVMTDSEEVTTAIHSLLQSLVEGGVLADHDPEGEDKVLQIEMDLPGFPGLVIQVPASALIPPKKPFEPSVEQQQPQPQQAPPPPLSSSASKKDKTLSLPGSLMASPTTSTVSPSDLASLQTYANLTDVVDLTPTATTANNLISSPPAASLRSPSVGAATKTTASPRRQTTMSGSVVRDGDQGLTLMTSSGLIRLPAGTQQIQKADGGLHIQLPPGMTLADIGL